MNNIPLAEALRPTTLDEISGQSHLLGQGAAFRSIVLSGRLPNMIFYGPPGIGKTCAARILADNASMAMRKLNATLAKTEDIKDVIKQSESEPVLLYLDEIQYFNKKQQQTLLECMESGKVTVISSTTENPYFYVYKALLSRSTIFEFKPLSYEETLQAIDGAMQRLNNDPEILTVANVEIEPDALTYIAQSANGDIRQSLNTIEAAVLSVLGSQTVPASALKITIDVDTVRQVSSGGMRYDRDGDEHYDILSGYQKSLRGSDANASLHYLARLLAAGDLLSACRRLMVCVCEDVGLANPNIIPIVKSCCDIAIQVGLAEAGMPLSMAVVLVANSPKSNSACEGIGMAMADVKELTGLEIPDHLKDAHYKSAAKLGRGQNYLFPHDYPNHWVRQQYLPDAIEDAVYYVPGPNFEEQKYAGFQADIRNE